MNVVAALHTDRMCASLTGLQTREFKDLVPQFEWNYLEYRLKLKGKRKRATGGGVKGKLISVEEKLLFVLMYLKTYPTIDCLAFIVGFDRSRASRWVQTLLPVLEITLKRKLVLPARRISSPEEFIRLFPGVTEVFGDATERRIQRFKNKKKQKKTYSGKKKTHTRKNVLLVDDKKRILVLTTTKSGRRHDKRLADKQQLFQNLPESVTAWVDTGFQGVQKSHLNTLIPKKNTKKNPLTETDKEENKIISSFRVIVENAISGIKRYQCLEQPYRNKIASMDDKLILLSAGLWNYHLSYST
jgi:hypothetical protein